MRLDRDLREAAARAFLELLGVDISPEFAACLMDDSREKVITGGQQAGKSYEGAAEIAADLATIDLRKTDEAGEPYVWRYWIVVPSYHAPHTEADYLARWLAALGCRDEWHNPQGGSCRILAYGRRVIIETKTGQQPEAIAGEPCDGVLVVEAGQMSEAVRFAAQGRIITRRGWIVEEGTLEDDENHPRWTWFAELAEAARDNQPGADVRSFELPTWANRTIFPDGERDPEIERLTRVYDPQTFDRRVRGRSTGVPNQVYPQLDHRRDERLKRLPWSTCDACHASGKVGGRPCKACDGAGRTLPFTWLYGAGGIDYGDVHPSAVTAITLNDRNEVWIRASRKILDGDANAITEAKAEFMQAFYAWTWGLDPLQRWVAALSGDSTEAVRMGDGSRAGRIGLTRTRLLNFTLYFDLDGEGVPELYEEMRRVHYRKAANGQLVLWRDKDDMTASLEDAIEVLDTTGAPLPESLGTATTGKRQAQPASSIANNRDFETLMLKRQDQLRRKTTKKPGRLAIAKPGRPSTRSK